MMLMTPFAASVQQPLHVHHRCGLDDFRGVNGADCVAKLALLRGPRRSRYHNGLEAGRARCQLNAHTLVARASRNSSELVADAAHFECCTRAAHRWNAK